MGLNQKLKSENVWFAIYKLELLKRITDGSLGAESPATEGYEQ